MTGAATCTEQVKKADGRGMDPTHLLYELPSASVISGGIQSPGKCNDTALTSIIVVNLLLVVGGEGAADAREKGARRTPNGEAL